MTFRIAWCREHSAVTATELLQLLNCACGTLFWSSCTIHTSPMDCSDNS